MLGNPLGKDRNQNENETEKMIECKEHYEKNK